MLWPCWELRQPEVFFIQHLFLSTCGCPCALQRGCSGEPPNIVLAPRVLQSTLWPVKYCSTVFRIAHVSFIYCHNDVCNKPSPGSGIENLWLFIKPVSLQDGTLGWAHLGSVSGLVCLLLWMVSRGDRSRMDSAGRFFGSQLSSLTYQWGSRLAVDWGSGEEGAIGPDVSHSPTG